MEFTREDFTDSFIAETRELIAKTDSMLLDLKNSTHNLNTCKEILRVLHTIKGSARMLNFSTVENLSHAMEDIVKGLDTSKVELTPAIISVLLNCTARISKALKEIEKSGTDNIFIKPYIETCNRIALGQFFTTKEIDDLIEEEKNEQSAQQKIVFSSDLQNTGSNSSESDNSIQQNSSDDEDISNIKTVRTDLNALNDILRSFDDLIIKQFRYRHQLENFENQLSTSEGMYLRELPKQLKEDINLYENALFSVQRQILNLRMLPLNMILFPLKVEIENDALKLGKDLILELPENNFMMDKVILEQLKKILIQLARNSLDHGIETTEERLKAGKSEKGKIRITVNQVLNRMIICVSDDGRGIDFDKVRKRAYETEPSLRREIKSMSNSELQQFLFINGFTTLSNTNEFSGRGIGLDIVRSAMETIKGKIKITSEKNKGTSFELNLPVSLASQQGVFIYSGGYKFMLPAHYINEIIDYNEETITTVQDRTFIKINEQNIPLYFLSSILNIKSRKNLSSILIAEYLDSKIAIAVDSIEQYETVMVNPLPKLLQNVEALQGMVYDEHYSIIPILDVPYLMKKLKNQLSYEIKKYEALNATKNKKILITDDSITTRQILASIVKTANYDYETAGDGIEAMEKLRSTHFDAVITDINMKRMDGHLLIKNMRLMKEFDSIPIIVVTGAYGKYDKTRFITAGANAYMTKSEFSRQKLLEALKEVINEYN